MGRSVASPMLPGAGVLTPISAVWHLKYRLTAVQISPLLRKFRTTSKQPTKPAARKGAPKPKIPIPKQVGSLLPSKVSVRMKYWEYVSLDPTAGQFGTYVYCPSSLYDPNYTGTGHQPMGFDQFAALYSHYTVERCKIVVSAFPQTVNTVPAVLGVLTSHDNGSAGPWPKVLEQQPTPPHAMLAGTANVASKYPTVTSTYNARAISGVVDLVDSDLAALVTASPADNYFFVIFYQALDQSADLSWTAFAVSLEYHAVFYSRKEVIQS